VEEESIDGESDEESHFSPSGEFVKSGGKSGAKEGNEKTLVGHRIAKEFSQGMFLGTIEEEPSASSRYWFVRYNDGDSEEMTKKEVYSAMSLYEALNEGKKEEKTSTKNRIIESNYSSGEDDTPLFASIGQA
jgi:hypothetical protein